jgi:hypothetical protein
VDQIVDEILKLTDRRCETLSLFEYIKILEAVREEIEIRLDAADYDLRRKANEDDDSSD